jgi:hypothetical protein
VPLAPSQHVLPVDAPSKTPIYVGVGAVVVALIIAIVVMSGGGSDDSGSKSAGTNTSSASSATTGTNPATAPASATQKPVEDKTIASLPKLRSAPPQIDPAARLGDTDVEAANGIRASLMAAGLNLRGVVVGVYKVTGTDQSLLVIDVDGAQASSLNSAMSNQNDQKKFAQAIVGAPAIKTAKIGRLALNITNKDAQGTIVLGMTMTMATLDSMAKGTLSDADAQKQVLIKAARK